MSQKIGWALCFCVMAGSHGLIARHAQAEDGNKVEAKTLVQNTDSARNNTQFRYRAPGDNSILRQHLGPASRNSQQTAVSASPRQPANTIMQNSDGRGSSQTAIITGGGGNTVIQNQTGSGNRQVVTQTGSGNRAIQIQRGTGKTSILNQRGHQDRTVIQE